MAELADALDLGSSVLRRGGSSPPERTVMSRVAVVLVEVAVVATGRRCFGEVSATYVDSGDYRSAVAAPAPPDVGGA